MIIRKRITATIVLLTIIVSCFTATNVFAGQSYGVDNLNSNKGDLYIGFLGGSITQGSGATPVENRYSSLITKEFFGSKFASKKVTEINAAVGGTGTEYGHMRMYKDLRLGTAESPDVVFVEFAVNDSSVSTPSRLKNMESIVRQLISQPKIPAIIFVYTFSSDSRYIDGVDAKSVEGAIEDFHEIAENYGIYEINLTEYIGKGIEEGKWLWNESGQENNLSIDTAHPNNFGYRVYADYIKECLEKDYDKAFNKIDPMTKPYGSDLFGVIEEIYFGDDRVVKSKEWKHQKRVEGTENHFYNGFYTNNNSLDATFEFEFEGRGVGMNVTRDYNNAYVNWSVTKKSTGEVVASSTIRYPSAIQRNDNGLGFIVATGLPKDTYIFKVVLSESEHAIKRGGNGKYMAIANIAVEKDLHSNLPGPDGNVIAPDVDSSVETENISQEEVKNESLAISGDKTVLYVATDGKDSNPGTIDKPFASLEKARDTIRSLKKSGSLGKDGAVVYIRGGEYLIQKELLLTEEDSGTENAPIVYRNYPDEEVKFMGAVDIDTELFKRVTDEKVLNKIADTNARSKVVAVDLFALGYTSLPEPYWPGAYSYIQNMPSITGREKPTAIASELVVNGNSLTIARYPNNDYMFIESVIEPGAMPRNWSKDMETSEDYVKPEDRVPTPFTLTVADERIKYWTEAKDALLYGYFYYSWADQTVPMASVDVAKHSITSKYPSVYTILAGQYFYIYNLLEEIDIPGEYFVDRENGILYLYPPESGINSAIYTTLEDYMFNLQETEYVTIKGIDMSYMRNGAIFAKDIKGVEIAECEIAYTGNKAVTLSGDDSKIYDCYIHDVEGGVVLDGGDRVNLIPGNNYVENCEFENCSRISSTYMPAVTLSGMGNKVVNNKIHGSPHLLIQFSGNDHLIGYNEIYDACQHTDDAGAMYAGRAVSQQGNRIINNYFHDIESEELGNNGVSGLYLDDYWSSAEISGNVFENVSGYGVASSGNFTKINNNIFVNVRGGAVRAKGSDTYNQSASEVFEQYTVQWNQELERFDCYSDRWIKKYPQILELKDENGKFRLGYKMEIMNNILYNSAESSVENDVIRDGTVENNLSYTSDPGFYDVADRNYLLKPDSKVYEKIPDFHPIAFTRMGQYSDRAINRIKKAYVLSAEGTDAFVNGEKVKDAGAGTMVMDGEMYIPLRKAVEIVGGTIDFNAETNEISISTGVQQISLTDGAKDKATVNGSDYEFTNEIVNKDYTNYVSMTDFGKLFEKKLNQYGSIVVISDVENLFTDVVDDGLLRYIETQLTVY